MNPGQNLDEVVPAVNPFNPPELVRRAWTVHFAVPTPKGTPAAQYKARLELLRKGQGCTTA